MSSWWDSVEAVDHFNTMMQVAIAVFGVLTGLATFLSLTAANRVSELKDQHAAVLRALQATLTDMGFPSRLDVWPAVRRGALEVIIGNKLSPNRIAPLPARSFRHGQR